MGLSFSLTIDQSCGPTCGYGGQTQPSVTGVFKRRRGRATQTVSFGFFQHIKFKNRTNLSSATVKGTFAGRRGLISMTFHATGPVIHPPSCYGRAEGRRGVLEGTYTLHAGKFFGNVTQKSFTATLWKGGAARGCTPRARSELFTTQVEQQGGPYVVVSKARGTGRVSEAIGVLKYGNSQAAKAESLPCPPVCIPQTWYILYNYLVTREPGRDYKFGPKIRSATVTGAGGISGTATYSAKKANARQSTGTLKGSLAVTVPAIGRVRPFANGSQGAVQRLSGAV